MKSYKIQFIIDEKANNVLRFDSNEKPIKGDVFTIQEVDGKQWEARITEVTKVIIRANDDAAIIEYRCRIQKHDSNTPVIGFVK